MRACGLRLAHDLSSIKFYLIICCLRASSSPWNGTVNPSLTLHHSTHERQNHPHHTTLHHSTHVFLNPLISFMMAVRAVTSCSLFRPSSPPLFSSALRFFPYRSRGPPSLSLRYGAHTQTRSVQSLFNSLMEELRAARKRRQKRVSAAASKYPSTLSLSLPP